MSSTKTHCTGLLHKWNSYKDINYHHYHLAYWTAVLLMHRININQWYSLLWQSLSERPQRVGFRVPREFQGNTLKSNLIHPENCVFPRLQCYNFSPCSVMYTCTPLHRDITILALGSSLIHWNYPKCSLPTNSYSPLEGHHIEEFRVPRGP